MLRVGWRNSMDGWALLALALSMRLPKILTIKNTILSNFKFHNATNTGQVEIADKKSICHQTWGKVTYTWSRRSA